MTCQHECTFASDTICSDCDSPAILSSCCQRNTCTFLSWWCSVWKNPLRKKRYTHYSQLRSASSVQIKNENYFAALASGNSIVNSGRIIRAHLALAERKRTLQLLVGLILRLWIAGVIRLAALIEFHRRSLVAVECLHSTRLAMAWQRIGRNVQLIVDSFSLSLI